MSSSIIFFQVLPFGSTTVVWGTKSTVNKRTFFCEDEDCGNETHSDTLCESCRTHLVSLFMNKAASNEEDLDEIKHAAEDYQAWEAGEIDDDGNATDLTDTLEDHLDRSAECIFEPFEYEGAHYCKNGLQQVYKRTDYFLDYVGLYNLTTGMIDTSIE
jgi:hypothetical protein